MFPRDELGQGRAETLTVWINGAGCARWDAMDDAQAARTVADELARVCDRRAARYLAMSP